MHNWIIYILFDPRYPKDVRYVGKTSKLLCQRLSAHLCAKKDTHVVRWIKKIRREGHTPIIREIECGTDANWQNREQYWIAWHREHGHPLCNLTDGGDGGLNPSPETREKMSAAKRGKAPRLKPDSHFRANATRMARIAAGEISYTPTQETIEKRRIILKEIWRHKIANGWTPPANWSKYRPDNHGRECKAETRKKIGDANRGRILSVEARHKMSVAKKGKTPPNKGLDFQVARRIVHELHIKNLKEHQQLYDKGALPKGMPRNPQMSYAKHLNWKGQPDFFRG
jgi:hypothetical protein